jgi:hypothetical protein
MAKKIIEVGQGDFAGNDSRALQRAVDSLAYEGGGTVVIPPGTYEMIDALHLRSGVNIQGSGRETVLKMKPSVKVPLADYLGYGHYELLVDDPDKLQVGQGVLIQDDHSEGFSTTTTTLIDKAGDTFYLDGMLNSEYDPGRGACAITIFPLISSRYAENTSITNLTLDGNEKQKHTINGCRGGGIYLLQSHKVVVDGIEVRNYQGDAISLQQCTDITVQNCRLHQNSGSGVQPGSGSVRYVVRNNRIHHNGGNGIYFRLRTTHSLCEDNEIHDNSGAAISIGERDTDHLIRSNECWTNGGPGVLFRDARYHGADRIILHGNAFRSNCQKEGEAEVVVGENMSNLFFRRNFFYPDPHEDESRPVACVSESCRHVYFFDNTVAGAELTKGKLNDPEDCATIGEPDYDIRVGPAQARPESARHLGTQLPADWQDAIRAIDDLDLGEGEEE